MVVDEVWNFLRRQAMLIRRHIGMKYLKKMPEMLFLGFQDVYKRQPNKDTLSGCLNLA